MLIEILTFDGCPNASLTHDRVAEALASERIAADIEEIEVSTPELANELRFLGSPSVRVNGEDVEVAAHHRSSYGLMCRTYRDGGRVEGAPSAQLIRAAIRAASER